MNEMHRAELLIFFPTKLFFSGERVIGYAELRIPAQMGILGVKIDIFGREYYTRNLQEALKTNSNRRVTNIFYEHTTKLEGKGSSKTEEKQFFGLLSKKTNTILQPGVYRYDFDIPLPDFLPPTYKTNMNAISGSKSNYGLPSIDYELRCTCLNTDKSVGNLISSAAVPIGGSLMTPSFLGNNTVPYTDSKVKTFMFASGGITTTIQFPTRVFLTGDSLLGQMTIENNSQKTATDCELSFIQRVDCMRQGYKEPLKSDVYVIKKIILGELKSKERKVITFNPQTGVKVPDFCVESVFTHQKMGTLVNVNYLLKLTGKISMATDLDYEQLVYVANRARHAPFQQMQPQQTQQFTQPLNQPVTAASPFVNNSPQQPVVNQFQQPPQQTPNQFQQPNYSQPYVHPYAQSLQQSQSQPEQQPLRRNQSQFEEFRPNEEHNEQMNMLEGSAPPEQESTDIYEYKDDNSMGLYPTLDKGVAYNLPPIPISVYDSQARKILEEERNHQYQQPPQQYQHQYQQPPQQYNPQYSQPYHTNYQQ
ncbi:predicted protein [Naegleria gruberi]|uniref:Predicted protein n=1 Tax=Naegleria gruberi TaxID=5762 RepID=D2VFM4_NAEGR|nr:uncharacterized protein NAEGRDRAFT_79786 [Naegleria gruberi]EFC44497.1 predicted protein [Naegleria gruberi]|eukprot:XP_002677241.1 predicted protein [Naegleria gruberi strain NEG-M]